MCYVWVENPIETASMTLWQFVFNVNFQNSISYSHMLKVALYCTFYSTKTQSTVKVQTTNDKCYNTCIYDIFVS